MGTSIMDKARVIILYILLLRSTACQSGRKAGEQSGADKPVENQQDVMGNNNQSVADTLSGNFYKHFEGKIAGKDVVLDLQSLNHQLSDSYYYLDHRKSISLSEQTTASSGDTLVLEEKAWNAGEEGGYPLWKIVYTAGGLKGIWYSKDGDKTYAIGLQEQYPEGTLPLNYYYFEKEYPAFPDRKDSPHYTIRLQYPYASAETPHGTWVNTRVKNILDFDFDADFKQGKEQWIKQLLQEYRSQLHEMDSAQLSLAANDWQNDKTVHIFSNQNGYLQLETGDYVYLGGAHGTPFSRNYVLDIRHEKQLVLSDITGMDSLSLQQLIEAQFRKDYLKEGDSLRSILFEDHLAANENFSFDMQGITFTYVPYEVAPFAAGYIYVKLPYAQLKGTLVDEFKQRMGL